MNTHIKHILGVLLLVIIFSSIYYINIDETGDEKTVHLSRVSSAIDYAPYIIAKEQRRFESTLEPLGWGVTYTIFQSLASVNEAFATGNIDITFEAGPPAIIASAAGIDITIPEISTTLIQEIVVPIHSNIHTRRDLIGKKIAVFTGSSSHYGLLTMLKEIGISEDDISIINMPPADAQSAFETGAIDAWAVWPPFTEQVIENGSGRILPGSNTKIHSLMVMRSDFQKESPKIAQAISHIITETKIWIQDHPQEAQIIIVKEMKLKPSVVALAWPKHDWEAKINDDVIIDIQNKADFLKNQGKLTQSLDVRKGLFKVW